MPPLSRVQEAEYIPEPVWRREKYLLPETEP
jgi:hypothetical protein